MSNPFFCPYRKALAWQRALVRQRGEDRIGDVLLLVEHEPVITLGSSAKPEHLLLDRAQYAQRGIAVLSVDRGGDVTYHGPGQLLAYPIVKLAPHERDLRRYLRLLEEVGIQTLRHFGVKGFRTEGATGVWTEAGKIAAIGVRLKRWVTYHGMALNVSVEPEPFTFIVPCGLTDRRVATLAGLLRGTGPLSLTGVADVLVEAFQQVFRRHVKVYMGCEAPCEAAL